MAENMDAMIRAISSNFLGGKTSVRIKKRREVAEDDDVARKVQFEEERKISHWKKTTTEKMRSV